jgi:hypothetical protein
MSDGPIFDFELDFAGTLRCIPMVVRFKLDQCGVKLSLRQWSRFDHQERRQLVSQACSTEVEVQAYRTCLVALIETRVGEAAVNIAVDAHPDWSDTRLAPARLRDYAIALGLTPPSVVQWASLSPLQRFALYKLTRPGHDNDNFEPAMREFGLAGPVVVENVFSSCPSSDP